MNARFYDGQTKITLKPGQTLTWSRFEQTEEGFASCHVTFELDRHGELLTRTIDQEGRDCDGRYAAFLEQFCPVTQSAARWNEYARVFQPAWSSANEYQRDYTAENEGY